MADPRELRARLADAGLLVSDGELERLSATYSQVRTVLAGFVALESARYETPALGFGPTGELADWSEAAQ